MIGAMVTCSRCSTENADSAKFCNECAAPLAAPSEGRRERRVVSVLFADLVGFTSRSERLDVEDVDGFLGRYHRLLRHELERHGGTVEKFIGDAVMALFGAPVAHEDDPERAVRAALSIQDAVAEMRERDGIDLHVRVGVTTGQALVALRGNPAAGEGMATGDVVNTAARVQSAAPVDGVLVDETTYRATDRAIRYAPAESVQAKGKSEPIVVWQAVEPRAIRPEQSRVDDLPLVGREREVAQLAATMERSRHEPSAQLVTVVGAPGIGKTRLVQELLARVEQAPEIVTWRRGRSLAYGEGAAFWALGEMVKAEAGVLESDSAATTADKLDAAVAAVMVEQRDRDWVARHLRPLVGLEAPTSASAEGGRVEAFAAWRRFFESLAEYRPTVLVFEDLHWADDALLDFIDLLADRAGAVPLLIVCTARPELLERRSGWSGGKTNAQTILLPPLTQEATARLVGDLLDQSLLPAETQRALLERAEGNPLYAQEYVRMLTDRGLLVREAGGWRLTGEPEGLPESVQGIIAARLDTLTEQEKGVIQDASVVGKVAWIGAVCAISDTSDWQAEELLHGLERKQLLRRSRRSSVAGEVEFGFTHALTQEVAYGQIRRVERAHKHERAAGWIEMLSGEREDKAELLAYHYSTALGLRVQAGEPTDEVATKARDALVEAGRQAEAVNAHQTAARHFAAALKLSREDDSLHRQLMFGYASALYRAGAADEATLQAALDAQLAAEDWEAAASVSHVLGYWFDREAAEGDRADAAYAVGADYAGRIPYTPVASLIAYRQAFRLVVTGRPHEALTFTEHAIERAERADDTQGRALLLMWHADARISTGDASGIDEMREAVHTLASHAHPTTPTAHHNLAENLVGLGDLHGASVARGQATIWAERFAEARVIGMVRGGWADAAYHAGDWDGALDESVRLTRDPSSFVAQQGHMTRGRIVLAQGNAALALQDAEAILDYAVSGRNDEWLLQGLAIDALARHRSDETEQAGFSATRFLDRWQEIGGMPAVAPALAELARLPNIHDRLGQAAALLPDASRWKDALAAIAEGRSTDAAKIYHEMGSKPLEAQAHLLVAQHVSGQGRSAEAAPHAQRALDFYLEVGAILYAEEATSLLRESA